MTSFPGKEGYHFNFSLRRVKATYQPPPPPPPPPPPDDPPPELPELPLLDGGVLLVLTADESDDDRLVEMVCTRNIDAESPTYHVGRYSLFFIARSIISSNCLLHLFSTLSAMAYGSNFSKNCGVFSGGFSRFNRSFSATSINIFRPSISSIRFRPNTVGALMRLKNNPIIPMIPTKINK